MKLYLPSPMHQRVPVLDPRRLMEEHEIFGYSHLDVGAELARRWKFPDVFSSAIAASANPLAPTCVDPLPAVIQIAAWRSPRAEENRLSVSDMEGACPAEVGARIAMSIGRVLRHFSSWDVLSEGMQALMS